MQTKEYKILKVKDEPNSLGSNDFWEMIPILSIDKYLWIENNYHPKVQSQICYTDEYLFVHFKTYESEITARYTQTNEPVHKDSCVEFFLNLFPSKTDKYFNFEMNGIGTIYVGYGALGNRIRLLIEDIETIEIETMLTKLFSSKCCNEYWEVFYKIPISTIEKLYDLKFIASKAKGNFCKCGDDTK